VTNNECIWVHI